MANNHPTIDLLKAPSEFCPSPVWNCIEYCFRANDYRYQNAADAFFILTIDGDNANGLPFVLAGYNFSTSVGTSYNTVNWIGTNLEIATDLKTMLDANFAFSNEYEVTIIPGVLPTDPHGLLVLSRIQEQKDNWIFDFSSFTVNPPAVFAVNGQTAEYESNYRLIVEIWRCNANDQPEVLLSRNAYEPDPLSLELCVDISRNVSCLVGQSFPGLVSSELIILDPSSKERICLKYGEAYDDGVSGCEAVPRFFENASPITIINSAFQRDDPDKFEPFCQFNEFGGLELFRRFMTNQPETYELCPDSFAWLSYCIDPALVQVCSPDFYVYVTFNYTDATSDVVITDQILSAGVNLIPYGGAQIFGLADPLKTVQSYSIQIETNPLALPISENREVQVRSSGGCCEKFEFYFLNEVGGWDTIIFNAEREVDLNVQFAEFCGFENCEGDILQGGKGEVDKTAFEVFRTTSKFLDDYQNRDWIREFLKSPVRIANFGGKAYKIIFTNNEFALYRREGFIYITIEFLLSFELNQQQI